MDPNVRRGFAYKLTQFIWLIFGLLESMLGLRFLLKLLGANPGSPVSQLIYGITAPLLAPFHALLGQPTVGDAVFEATTLVAMLVYLVVAWAVFQLATIVLYPPAKRSGNSAPQQPLDSAHSKPHQDTR